MKRILYIDPFSTDGHKNFNEIYLRNLACLEVELTCVFRDGYFEELHFENKKTRLYKIPKKYYKGNRNSFFVFSYFEIWFIWKYSGKCYNISNI